MNPNKKNPSRWRPAYLVRTIDRLKPFKDVILATCSERADSKAEEVALRVNGAVTDLHSAEARYHDDCRKLFMGSRNVQSVVNASCSDVEIDVPFETTCISMMNSPEKIWSSIELYAAYQEEGGKNISRRELMAKVKEHFGEKVIVLTSPGIASIIMFTVHASSVLTVVRDDDEYIDFSNLAKKSI